MPTTANDVYSDRDAAPEIDAEVETETETAEDSKEEGGDDDKSSESATGLVSKTFFGDKDLKPGTTCKVRVEKVYDDQVSISYVAHDESDSDDDDKPKESDDVYAEA